MITSKRRVRLLFFLTAFCSTCLLRAQDPVAAETYEDPPTLNARQILLPQYLEGPQFHVEPDVPTYAGANQYTIVSTYGTFVASGNELLIERVREINALEKMDKIKESDEFTKALKKASASPMVFARNLAKQPVETVTGVPKGIWRLMNRVGDGVKGAGEKIRDRDEDKPKDPYDEGVLKNAAGFPKAKRELAKRLGVDPYTTNEVLQREMNRLAWTSVGGGSTLSLLMMPVGGAAGTALSATYFVSDLDDDLHDLDTGELRKRNEARLRALGIDAEDAAAFLNSASISPTRQTAIIGSLAHLGKAQNLGGFIHLASAVDSEPDAVFFQRTAAIMAKLADDGAKIARVGVLNGIPICVTADGSIIVAVEWDYAAWTPLGERFVNAISQPPAGQEPRPVRIILSGVASDRVHQELARRKIELVERAVPGPLLPPPPPVGQ